MCGMHDQSGNPEILEAMRPVLNAIASVKHSAYTNCKEELQTIIDCNIKSISRIEALFDELLNFYDDDDFMGLFWELIRYVEAFDTGISTFYRRQEELLNEGL